MNIKESTVDGNLQVYENLLRQGGIGEPGDKHFDPVHDINMTEYIQLCNGDLMSKEQLETGIES
jgi:hypothetical protein